MKGVFPMFDAENTPLDEGTEGLRENLQKASKPEQIKAMRDWFFRNFEDPVESCPHDSREGGYQWIWGGPCYAHDVITDEFDGIVPEEVIQELVEELNYENPLWSPIPNYDDFDEYLIDAIGANTHPLRTLNTALDGVFVIIDANLPSPAVQQALQLSIVGTVAALEAFFSDLFIHTVLPDSDLLRRFIETNPEFRKRRFSLSEIFQQVDRVSESARKYLSGLLWHNIAQVRRLYETTLSIKIPNGIDQIARAVDMRHDIVHRGGRTTSGNILTVTKKEAYDIARFAREFAIQLNEAVDPSPF